MALSRKAIPETDLPPEGTRSLFDHVIAQNDGLPYPFPKLIEMLQEQHPNGEPPITFSFPTGAPCSRDKPTTAIRVWSWRRTLMARTRRWGWARRHVASSNIALVENANELEVLSYNEAAGRFEFQLVQNYCAGCVPRIVYARRQICLTCHQGSAPIFSVRPWSETNGQPEVARAIAAARGKDDPYEGVPLQQPLAQSERFDQLTDVGNFLLVSQRLWLDGCGPEEAGGNECRRRMLSLALQQADNPGRFVAQGPEVDKLRELQAKTYGL